MTPNSKPTLDTSQEIRHVFICNGEEKHLSPGFALLRTSRLVCPSCGADVTDVTGSPVAQAYYAFTRPDLWRKQ